MSRLPAHPRLWLLNFDAEDELAGEQGSRAARQGRPLPWCGPMDWEVRPGNGAPLQLERTSADVPLEGAAWCPTPRALKALEEAGVTSLPRTPGVDVLRAANARETFADCHPLQGLGALVGTSVDEVQAAVQRAAPARASGRAPAWLMRRSLCAAGQGRLLVEAWSAKADAWVERALATGPVHVLPMVDVELEFSLHAFLRSDKSVQLGRPVVQSVRGAAWRSAEAWSEAPWVRFQVDSKRVLREGERLREEVCARLAALGYRGPVGIDGFLWRDESGRCQTGWGTDVNARYTMSIGAAFDVVPSEADANSLGCD